MIITTLGVFDKQLKKLNKKIQQEFENRLELLILNDCRKLNLHKLSGEFDGFWSFNVTGDIRVIFDRRVEGVIFLVAIGTHSELYG